MMPNHTVPTNLKLLRGNPGHRPIPPEPEPPVFTEAPPPPDYLTGDAVAEWHRMAPILLNTGLLTLADLPAFAAWCRTYGRWIEAERALQGQPLTIPTDDGKSLKANPLLHISAVLARDLVGFACQFGMTPAARARFSAGLKPPPKKFGRLVAG
jgi:P27 family predicted phage terminase small subunit